MRVGIFGKGRLGSAIAAEGGDAIAWTLGRGQAPPSPVDVAIDASSGSALADHLSWALESGTPLVIGTTGWSMPDLAERVGNRIGVLVAPNFSLTVALLTRLATVMGRFAALDPARDLYIHEHHHDRKHDAPSGTAKLLARSLIEACPRKTEWIVGGPVRPHQLSVGVVRAGSTYSTHTLGLDAPGEVLEFHHMARSAAPFAQGALAAAKWILDHPGVHPFDAVAGAMLGPLFEF